MRGNKDPLRRLKLLVEKLKDLIPAPDTAHCSSCGGKFPVSDCPTEEDGDWETGYYEVHVCPVCEDGGCLEYYSYSEDL